MKPSFAKTGQMLGLQEHRNITGDRQGSPLPSLVATLATVWTPTANEEAAGGGFLVGDSTKFKILGKKCFQD